MLISVLFITVAPQSDRLMHYMLLKQNVTVPIPLLHCKISYSRLQSLWRGKKEKHLTKESSDSQVQHPPKNWVAIHILIRLSCEVTKVCNFLEISFLKQNELK